MSMPQLFLLKIHSIFNLITPEQMVDSFLQHKDCNLGKSLIIQQLIKANWHTDMQMLLLLLVSQLGHYC
jgi:hypothetical protein